MQTHAAASKHTVSSDEVVPVCDEIAMAEGRVISPGARLCATLLLIGAWYASNILVLLGNKYLLSNHGFHYPVFLTLSHMVACTALGGIVALSGAMPLKKIKSRNQFSKVALLAFIFCATIVLGNMSMRYLPVSFTQAVGSTTPFFTAVLAYIFQGTKESPLAYLALVPVMGGVVIGSGGEPAFHMLGFCLCLLATAGRAAKSVVQAILMADPAEKMDPMSLVFWMSACCCLYLVPLAAVAEPTALDTCVRLYNANANFAWWMLVNAALAYLTNLLNFAVTKWTSALTLQVLGNAKGVVAAGVSVMVFGNAVTAQGMLGYAVTVLGVLSYSEAKRRAKASTAKSAESQPLLTSPGSQAVDSTAWVQVEPYPKGAGLSPGPGAAGAKHAWSQV
ncbi:hypothetical protein QJQ45_005781 [Haematococcus lacustris]|nr:hypothetical protein QJQ45_005781 [Haematococcus lacustris]